MCCGLYAAWPAGPAAAEDPGLCLRMVDQLQELVDAGRTVQAQAHSRTQEGQDEQLQLKQASAQASSLQADLAASRQELQQQRHAGARAAADLAACTALVRRLEAEQRSAPRTPEYQAPDALPALQACADHLQALRVRREAATALVWLCRC